MMRKFTLLSLSAVLACMFSSCGEDNLSDNAELWSFVNSYDSYDSDYQRIDFSDDQNANEYSSFEPSKFLNVLNDPVSTFAADVDTASYSIFRYMMNNNALDSNALLRTEEMINYFKYDYPEPNADEPFSVTMEYVPCPWNDQTKLLLIGTQTHKIDVVPQSNLVFLIDVSGSMDWDNKLELLKQSLIAMLPTFNEKDIISIVTYADGEKVVIDGANPVKDREKLTKAIESLSADGATAGQRGMEMAYEIAEKHFIEGGNNRIIMGTDGDLNVGISNPEDLKAFVENKREHGVFLSLLGFGWENLKDNRMETLADNGNGSYHYIDSIMEAERVLVEERNSTLFVAAKDAKFQLSFNPDNVAGYRLIGYENRALKNEDFTNDAVDGGEIGANHQVTMLYEIVPPGSKAEIQELRSMKGPEITAKSGLGTFAVRYKVPGGSDESIQRDYVINVTESPNLSNNIALAAAVAETAMLINHSIYSGSASFNSILSQLANIKNISDDKYKSEFVELVKKAKILVNATESSK